MSQPTETTAHEAPVTTSTAATPATRDRLATGDGQISVAEMKKNDFLGEIAILCDVPRTATIKAREPVSTLKISKDTFYRMVGEFPQMAIEIMRELAHRVEDTNKKLREATASKAA
jgi:CRP-like cAMP-binding protein